MTAAHSAASFRSAVSLSAAASHLAASRSVAARRRLNRCQVPVAGRDLGCLSNADSCPHPTRGKLRLATSLGRGCCPCTRRRPVEIVASRHDESHQGRPLRSGPRFPSHHRVPARLVARSRNKSSGLLRGSLLGLAPPDDSPRRCRTAAVELAGSPAAANPPGNKTPPKRPPRLT